MLPSFRYGLNTQLQFVIGLWRRRHTARIPHRYAHASLLGEGCAVLARRRTGWADSLPPNSRRAAPPIYPDLIVDRHRGHGCEPLVKSQADSHAPVSRPVQRIGVINSSSILGGL